MVELYHHHESGSALKLELKNLELVAESWSPFKLAARILDYRAFTVS